MNVKLYKNKDWLKRKYIGEKLSSYQIGRECNSDPTTICTWLRKNNISIRSLSGARHFRSLRQVNHCTLSAEALKWINGELLGDGCLGSLSSYSAAFFYGSKYFEYCEYIRDTLKSFGILSAGKIYLRYYKVLNCYGYFYNSLCYKELLDLRKKWYPNGKKIVPRDIKLTPLTVRQWYIGDGCLSRPKNYNPYIQLSTCGFTILDVEWLVQQLIKLGFKATRYLSSNIIHISVHSVQDFLNYIGPCPVWRYQYKWNYYKRKEV